MINKQKLTFDQNKALEKFNIWLDEKPSSNIFILSGYAGSGKTFLARKFLKIVESRKICWTVAAPTHKAVGVLRKALDKEQINPTWYPATIHRLLRLKLKRKGNLEVCEKTDKTLKALDQLGMVLIDEASMLESNLLEIVISCAKSFNTRLVFVGDPAQLPPIGESVSPVFSIIRATKSHLNEVVRHQGSVLKLANLIKEKDFPCSAPPCFSLGKPNSGVIGSLDQTTWLEQAKLALKESTAKNDPDSVRILCYTNRYLERLTPHARRALHGKLADEMPVLPGEVLISRRAVMSLASLKSNEKLEEPGILLGSNTEMIVEDVNNEKFYLPDNELGGDLGFDIPEINSLVAKVRVSNNIFLIRLMPEIGSNSRVVLDKLMNQLSNLAKKLSKKESRHIWKNFFYLRDSFAFVGPASVLTVHRSQGSTFEEVYIASDVFWAREDSLRKHLLYVAVSRASKAVWLAGDSSINPIDNIWNDKLIFSN
ncbi:ATP-dependent DNA helicase [Prochlorococcus marinus]|uniref:ATP-dependent DNA helicase n=1 Tax=Prochlorococcus marinus TaxID=1219 RepID=UPI0022B3457D|nr:ATP-dependent helicase [Prochlorococcus marinus]